MTSIQSIACALPDHEVSNSMLDAANPSWEMDRVVERTGVVSRRVAAADETAYDLSVRACEALLADSEVDLDRIDAVLYCTQSPDYKMPGNAHLLHAHLGLGGDVLAFDYTLACSGYVYGLAFADSFIGSGLATEVLLVTAETMSKRINAHDRSTRALFGDGAAVTHLSASEGDGGGRIAACALSSSGGSWERVYIPAGGARAPHSEATREETVDRNGNVRCAEDMLMDGRGVWAAVNTLIPPHLRTFLDNRSLTFDDVDLCVFHQASRMTFDSLARALDIPPEKLYDNLAAVGNLSSASIPVALRSALDEQAIRPGDRVLLCGFGAGLSYGSVLVEF